MNDLAFVEETQTLLRSLGIETWVFGGWGEELRGLIRPREHADLDLLYPGETWDDVDALGLDWLPGKRQLVAPQDVRSMDWIGRTIEVK